jgi:hypothetical protein
MTLAIAVEIENTIVGDSLITVRCIDTGTKFDVKTQNLGKLLHEISI